MKRFLLSLVLLVQVIVAHAQLPTAQDFELDPGQVFSNLDQLELVLAGAPNDVARQQLVLAMAATMPDSAAEQFLAPAFKLNAFQFATVVSCIGSCASIGPIVGVGAVLYVYANTKGPTRKEETNKAWLGCLAGNAPCALFMGAFIALTTFEDQGQF